jgi:hypothetical protein
MEEILMKTVKLLAVALVSLASLPLLSQQADLSTQETASSSAAGSPVNESANTGVNAQRSQSAAQVNGGASGGGVSGSAAAAEEMRPVNGELVSKLDSKSAKAGDRVVLKTTEAVKTAGGTVIPKGTHLVGHVTSVQARGSGSANSQMAIQFDRAELKSGQSLPIHSEIRSVMPPASSTMADSMSDEEAFGGSALGAGSFGTSGGTRMGSGATALTGGLAGTGSRVGTGLNSTANQTANQTVRESGHTAVKSAAAAGHANLAAGAAGGAAAHATPQATGVRGVMLAGASGKTSGTLSATRQNVRLESGTQMTLGVSSAQ